ncbi:MAG: OstA-like protein [Candidatus Angelobacter sp.]|jgi:lipopolysaccharide export system protein LptA|nr:OstA-like protein [Candidatus Angelobacter sp.]
MPLNPKTFRIGFAFSAIALLAVVMGFYAYARYRVHRAIEEIPKKLGADIQQSANGFTYTQSAGGRTIYSISAKKAIQFKGSQKAALNDVRIIVYGRGEGTEKTAGSTYDQIYGKEFDYDASTGEVKAAGDVIIDLEAKGKPGVDPAESGTTSAPIHLRTSGLTFNQKTGIAQTDEKIEFALPQARGSAVGAVYDSKDMALRLKSNVKLQTAAAPAKPHSSAAFGPANITAENALLHDNPREAVLNQVRVTDTTDNDARDLTADQVKISLRDDNTVENVVASGNVNAMANNKKGGGSTHVQASEANFSFGGSNDVRTAVLTGGVKLDSTGASPMHGKAGRVVMDFVGKNQIAKVHASEGVQLQQSKSSNTKAGAANLQETQVQADAMDFFMKGGNRLDRAVTSGASQIVLNSDPTKAKSAAGSRTVITANRFEAGFGANNHPQSLHGTGDTKIVSAGSAPGAPDRISTSRELFAQFDPVRNGVTSVTQEGDLKYSEGPRTASADRARYITADDTLALTGNVRVQDAASGLSLTSDAANMNRKTGEYTANGDVKTTYNQMKANPSGAMLASHGGDPTHVTARSMTANRNADIVRYTGGARLWQGANLVQAPVIVFDRGHRSLTASGEAADTKGAAVETVFVQTDKSGKVTPITIKAAKLTYSDNDRHARFDGGVQAKTSDAVMTGEHVDILLRPKSQKAASTQGSASEVEQIVAEGPIVFEQQNPVRKATGQHLVYTASDGKFVLTGEPGKPPSIFDAERGNVTGDSLTFYNRDDRVQVGSGESSRTVTRTRIKDESKP